MPELIRRTAILCCALAVVSSAGAQEKSSVTGAQPEVLFSEYSPLAASAELVRRTFTPLDAQQVAEGLEHSGTQLPAQSVDLSAEKFVLYVPAQAPAGGYALLVFVPPWDDARLPDGWREVLDRYGMIFVSAARSGNDQNVTTRREPLALLGAYNVIQRYAVNPQHVYVGGFSGGSRTAMRLAVAYPDLFRGALLNAGADPFVPPGAAVPPADLLRTLQESSRLVYVTGERDTALPTDVASRQSMRRWCVMNVDSQITLNQSHDVAKAYALASALRLLVSPPAYDAAKLASCRAGIEKELNSRLDKVQELIDAHKRPGAQALLREIDRRFGGLAAPRSLALQSAINLGP
jgi:dienelactone hydrolase